MSAKHDDDLDEIIGFSKKRSSGPDTSLRVGTPNTNSNQRRTGESQRALNRKKRVRRQKIITASVFAGIAIALLLILILVFKGCFGNCDLYGVWNLDGTTVYQFEDGGKGAMILPSNTYAFTYVLDEKEKTISIDFESEKATDYTYSYKLSKNTLVLYGSEGLETFNYEFKRVNDK